MKILCLCQLMVRVEGAREDIYPVVEAVGMWESRRDFQRVWEGWEAGFMAFHTLSFPWPTFRAANAGKNDMPPPSAMCRTRQEMLICTHRLSMSALRLWAPRDPPRARRGHWRLLFRNHNQEVEDLAAARRAHGIPDDEFVAATHGRGILAALPLDALF
jgi:hypothetical protein